MSNDAVHDEDDECHCHEDRAQEKQLKQRLAGARFDELGQERQKEDGELRVQDVQEEGFDD